MIELKNIQKERDGKKRIYRAEFEVESRQFNFQIEEWYWGNGVEYNVKIREKGKGFISNFFRPQTFPRMNESEWYDFFFYWSNKKNTTQ